MMVNTLQSNNVVSTYGKSLSVKNAFTAQLFDSFTKKVSMDDLNRQSYIEMQTFDNDSTEVVYLIDFLLNKGKTLSELDAKWLQTKWRPHTKIARWKKQLESLLSADQQQEFEDYKYQHTSSESWENKNKITELQSDVDTLQNVREHWEKKAGEAKRTLKPYASIQREIRRMDLLPEPQKSTQILSVGTALAYGKNKASVALKRRLFDKDPNEKNYHKLYEKTLKQLEKSKNEWNLGYLDKWSLSEILPKMEASYQEWKKNQWVTQEKAEQFRRNILAA